MATTSRVPTPEDKFSFGLWTVGWTGTDPFGVASRPALDPWEYADKLAELGAWGITFHDNDVFPFDADEATQATGSPAQGGCRQRRPGHRDGHHQHLQPPGVQGRRPDLQRPLGAPVRAAQGAARRRPRRRARRHDLRHVGRARGQRVRRLQGPARPPSSATRRASTPSPATSRPRATTCGSRWSPSRTSRAATSSCPTVGHALALIAELEHGDIVGLNPETGHEQMANLNYTHARARRCGATSCSTSTSTASAA